MKSINDLFTENENLVYFILNKYFHNLPKDNSFDNDDWKQIGLLGLFKACKNFNSDKGAAFSTYASNVIIREILQNIRKLKKNKLQNEAFSLDFIYDNGEDDNLELVDMIESNKNDSYIAETYLYDLSNYIEKEFNERDSEILKMYIFKNNTQNEIAKKINISQAQVSRIIRNFKNKYINDIGM